MEGVEREREYLHVAVVDGIPIARDQRVKVPLFRQFIKELFAGCSSGPFFSCNEVLD